MTDSWRSPEFPRWLRRYVDGEVTSVGITSGATDKAIATVVQHEEQLAELRGQLDYCISKLRDLDDWVRSVEQTLERLER